MFKRIYATIPEKDFHNFRQRAVVEGLTIGEAFEAICHAYAIGAQIKLEKFKRPPKEHAKPTGIDYAETVEQEVHGSDGGTKSTEGGE